MTQKRRDNKRRVLRDRESQCKDGRYRYSYIENGKRKDIYSWKLEPTDKVPAGKRDCRSLRELEEDILRKQLLGKPNGPSFPNRFVKTIRPQKVTIQALNEYGEEIIVDGEDEMAKCFCHELEHLDGMIFLDKAIEELSVV